jgi:hypothetical protein
MPLIEIAMPFDFNRCRARRTVNPGWFSFIIITVSSRSRELRFQGLIYGSSIRLRGPPRRYCRTQRQRVTWWIP